jgi:hypothetical protein
VIVSALTVLAIFVPASGFVGLTQAQSDGGPADVQPDELPGSGTADDPYVISTAAELQAMEDDLDAHYELGADIDAAETVDWNGGAGFDPVGPNTSTEFTGSLDGNGHSISELTIDRPETDYVGLFGVMNRSDVRDVTLTNATVTGEASTGSVAGTIYGGTVSGVTASVTVEGSDRVGGLVGATDNKFKSEPVTITGASVSGAVAGNTSGGVVGRNGFDSTISDTDATADVTGNATVGGLVGANRGEIERVTASGTVDATGGYVGGLVGSNRSPGGRIMTATATGDVNGTDGVGGLVGANAPSQDGTLAVIENVSASGSVDGQNRTGGLAGSNDGKIRVATASGDVNGITYVGGLVGRNGGLFDDPTIQNSKATGAVTGTEFVGGLVGTNTINGVVRLSFATGAVSSSLDGVDGGGLVAENLQGFSGNTGTVNTSYWDTEATGVDSSAGNATGLPTADMTGVDALDNMTELGDGTWQPTETSYPVLRAQTSEAPPGETTGKLDISLSKSTITTSTKTAMTVTVTDSETGDPIEGATVEISDLLVSGTTDGIGEVTLTITPSVAGEYPVSVSADDYTDATTTLEVSPTDAAPAVVGDNPAQDINNDGIYEDVNGDGEFDIVDVNAFFENRQSDAIQNNSGLFDFNNDGEVDIIDVNQLFQNSQA